ncbi:hypothetical protein [Rarobacter faecitabidus]|nr:hypothetical protein [Rarobacter faecitabidus]
MPPAQLTGSGSAGDGAFDDARPSADRRLQTPEDVERRRKRVRWMTFFATLPVAVALLAIGAILTAVAGLGYAATRNYDRADHATAITQWGYTAKQNVIQRWKAPFGMGTSWLARENYDQAQVYLGRAYAATPPLADKLKGKPEAAGQPRCVVAHNYALSFEGTADALRDEARLVAESADEADDPAATLDDAINLYERAIEDYTSAMDIRTIDGCPDDPTANDREETKRQEAQDELDALRDPPENDQAPNDDSDPSQPPPDSENPDDADDQGDSNTDQDNPDDNPQSNDDEAGPDAEPDADKQDDSASPEDEKRQQQLEDLAERQRLARERAQLEQGDAGMPPTRGW